MGRFQRDTVSLVCAPALQNSRVLWYRRRGLERDVLILDSDNSSVHLPGEVRGRGNVSDPKSSVLISNLYRLTVDYIGAGSGHGRKGWSIQMSIENGSNETKCS